MRDYTDITVLLDRSGSMASIREATIESFNDFVAEQKAVPGDGCWTLLVFDDRDSAAWQNEPFPLKVRHQVSQAAMTPLSRDEFQPRGGTALLDAACKAIDDTGLRLASLPEHLRPTKVLFIIITDGMENQSRQYRRDDLRQRIRHQESKYNWKFVFLGANQDAIAEGMSYGISKNSSMTYNATPDGTREIYGKLSAGTRSWKLDGNNSAADLFVDPNQNSQKVSSSN